MFIRTTVTRLSRNLFALVLLSGLSFLGIALVSTSLSAQVYQARADTGRMAWGHTDYTRHTNAGYCDRAVAEVYVNYKRVYVPDTGAVSPQEPMDTVLPAEVIAAARACGERFTVDGTDLQDLWSLVRLLLVRGDDAQARLAVERSVSLQTTPGDSAAVFGKAIKSLLNAIPSRVRLAEAYLARLEAMGGRGRESQMVAHLTFASYWHRLYVVDSIRAHATRSIAIWKTMNRSEKNNVNITFAYDYLIELANDAGDLMLQGKLLGQAVTDSVGGWRGGVGEQWITGNMNVIALRKETYGKQTRPLEGTFWFNHQGVPRPTPGRVSFVVRLRGTGGWEWYELYEMIRSLQAKYGTALDVTLITSTTGSLPGSGPLTPADEAEGAARMIGTFLRLPVVLLVDETHVDTLSDGRLLRGGSRLDGLFPNGKNAFLTDRTGKLRWLGTLQGNRSDRRMLDAAIGRALQVDTSATETGSSVVSHP